MSLSRIIQNLLVPWTRLDWPLDWEAVFGRRARLGLELGFGNGEFLEGLAAGDPGTDWVGIEISWASAQRLLRRLDARGLTNARVLVGAGGFLLEHAFGRDSLDEIHVNNPDPWPKLRHHRRRLVEPRFLDLAARRLRPGGKLTVVTDHAEYADWIAEQIAAQRALSSCHPTAWADAIPGRGTTKYERRGVEAGSAIRYFEWRRTAGGGPEPPHVERLEAMPNVMFEGQPVGGDPLPGFRARSWDEERRGLRVLIQLLSVFARADRGEWLVEARVQEGEFVQELALSILPRADGRLLIKPAVLGFPRPTWGVKRAVQLLAGLVAEAHPELSVHSSSVGDVTPPGGSRIP